MMKFFKSDQHWVWFNAGAISISIVMVVGLIGFIAVKGLAHFWPSQVYQFDVAVSETETQTIVGEIFEIGEPESQTKLIPHLVKIGNREVFGLDFRWLNLPQGSKELADDELMVIERYEWGNFYGYLVSVSENAQIFATTQDAKNALDRVVERSQDLLDKTHSLEKDEIGAINYRLEKLRLTKRRLEIDGVTAPAEFEAIAREKAELEVQYKELEKELLSYYQQLERDHIVMQMADGHEVTIPAKNIVKYYQPNGMGILGKIGAFFSNIWYFLSEDPREANTQGGVFPAIFGTVMMVLLMSVLVTPLGVVAAVYMREYATQGWLTRIIRIAVNNLAGVPSIVYGVFGLGFFVYFLGGSIDELFYPEAKPSPTFGTSGLIWAALTLALLTLPVVIVSTEEGLARVPKSIREGSLALGATKIETLWRTVLPMSSPAMMTGLILAVARAAGEVAPLMLVGVVKLAPTLPLDGNAPFLHLDRKFMHLGFHIYDVGFQSPNVEAARPLVYATALLLVVVIVLLNLFAIKIRNQLREKYKSLEH